MISARVTSAHGSTPDTRLDCPDCGLVVLLHGSEPASFSIAECPHERMRISSAQRFGVDGLQAGTITIDEPPRQFLPTPKESSMLTRALAYLAAVAITAAALVVGIWLAFTGRRATPPGPIAEPPDFDDERAEVVAEVETMDRDSVVDELRKRGY